jgi:hypothetical protein
VNRSACRCVQHGTPTLPEILRLGLDPRSDPAIRDVDVLWLAAAGTTAPTQDGPAGMSGLIATPITQRKGIVSTNDASEKRREIGRWSGNYVLPKPLGTYPLDVDAQLFVGYWTEEKSSLDCALYLGPHDAVWILPYTSNSLMIELAASASWLSAIVAGCPSNGPVSLIAT